ncbi:hypothetical protein PPACK8108_LOCUS23680 [Phakopsora pachyrhizi]|uniref:GRAM domain-containing protein n=1 Tax=Phakopsora pachyrhizi TaxID=170000 RepID=A0AAV0BPW1_PHAPC|nr:hypothetical protein PPACK8108_LOCUS23680 [Phakopsora pachyrhizi]
MALNCVMISPNNDPIPLPEEKIFLRVDSVSVSLRLTEFGSSTTIDDTQAPPNTALPNLEDDSSNHNIATTTANLTKLRINQVISSLTKSETDESERGGFLKSSKGKIYVTNQRIIFITSSPSAAASPTAGSGQEIKEIRSLTIPLSNSFDGRFVQPWLSANYHLSNFTPVRGGNLENLLNNGNNNNNSNTSSLSNSPLVSLKVMFHEGHGFEFHEALEEVKRLAFDSDQRQVEDLPMYTPSNEPEQFANRWDPSSSTSLLPNQDQSASTLSSTSNNNNDSNTGTSDGNFERIKRSNSIMPDQDLLLAAEVAQQEERQEMEDVIVEPPPLESDRTDPDELPPGYHP